jgi:hypothetical protein
MVGEFRRIGGSAMPVLPPVKIGVHVYFLTPAINVAQGSKLATGVLKKNIIATARESVSMG